MLMRAAQELPDLPSLCQDCDACVSPVDPALPWNLARQKPRRYRNEPIRKRSIAAATEVQPSGQSR